jgi:large subunit ribosomal protein L22
METMEAKAILRNARVSPRKARLVADLVRGRSVDEAISILTFTRKKSALLVRKLVESALANAEHAAKRDGRQIDVDDVFVRTIFVDGGPVLRRFRPRALGRATRVVKRTSHITVVLAES